LIEQAVIGLGFGDESKGVVVDYLCSLAKTQPIVVRFSGGHQAGHHVITKNVRHVFSNFGSGSFKSAPTFWSRFCTVDPVGIMNEFNILKEKGCIPILYIDENCPITTPYDKQFNKMHDRTSGHGSCGVGFGATIQRNEDNYTLTFSDLFKPSIFKLKFELIKKYYGLKICIKDTPEDSIKNFHKACEFVKKSNFIEMHDESVLDKYKHIIYEGSQGLLLDQDIGFFPHVTRSNTGTERLLQITEKPDPEIFFVTRAYQTRHGAGPMTNEKIPFPIKVNPNETNKTHPYQGNFRQAMLDLDLLEYGLEQDGYGYRTDKDGQTLVVTCLEQLEKYKYTRWEGIIEFKSEDDFIKAIRDALGFKKVLKCKNHKFSTV
jgi:adenylosuccinate synthase